MAIYSTTKESCIQTPHPELCYAFLHAVEKEGSDQDLMITTVTIYIQQQEMQSWSQLF